MDFLAPIPSGHLPTINNCPHLGIAPQSPCSCSQPRCISVDLPPCSGYIGPQHALFLWFSVHSDCHRSAASLSDSLRCFPFCPNWLTWMQVLSCFSWPTHQVQIRCHSLPATPTSFLILPSFAQNYIFLSGGQGFLPVFNWFSVRSSASEDIFLTSLWSEMYSERDVLWREMYLLLCHLVSPQKKNLRSNFQVFFFSLAKKKPVGYDMYFNIRLDREMVF